MRWWVMTVLMASAAHAGERGFQFRASIDTGLAGQARLTSCADSCNGGLSRLEVGPLAALGVTAGARFGLFSFHGGGELQWTWFGIDGHSLRAGPLLGVSFHIERWLVLSLDTKGLFPLLGAPFGALGGALRWGFELTKDGTHQLSASVGAMWVGGVLWTTSVAYILTL